LSINEFVAVLNGPSVEGNVSHPARALAFAVRPLARLWRLAESHDLNPWVFIAMSLAGYMTQAMVFMPPFQTHAWKLTFLILLRLIALVVPAYIFLKGRRIAVAFNLSIAAMFVFNTTWHVCYFVFA
jgi:hypothetical protein